MDRRTFLDRMSGAGVLAALCPLGMARDLTPISIPFGGNGKLPDAGNFKTCGLTLIDAGTPDFLMPARPGAEFEAKLEALKAPPLPVLSCNGFIRPYFKLL